MWTLLSLLSCQQPGSGAATDAQPQGGDTALPPYTQEEPSPEWSAEEVGELLATTFDAGFPNGLALRDAYLAMMAEGDLLTCPAFSGDYSGAFPDDLTEQNILGCTSTSGYYYSGVCQYEAVDLSGAAGTSLAWALGGDFVLAYPDGDRFAAGGGVTWRGNRLRNGSETFQTEIRGTWYDESRTDWLGLGFSGLFTAEGGEVAGAPWLLVHGGVAVGDVDLFFDQLRWDQATCGGLPSGALRIRGTRGYWYVWTLDDDCDACGDLVFHGDADLGQLCLDLSEVGLSAHATLAVP